MTTYGEYAEFKISLWAGGQELLIPIKEDELVQMLLQVAHSSMASEFIYLPHRKAFIFYDSHAPTPPL